MPPGCVMQIHSLSCVNSDAATHLDPKCMLWYRESNLYKKKLLNVFWNPRIEPRASKSNGSVHVVNSQFYLCLELDAVVYWTLTIATFNVIHKKTSISHRSPISKVRRLDLLPVRPDWRRPALGCRWICRRRCPRGQLVFVDVPQSALFVDIGNYFCRWVWIHNTCLLLWSGKSGIQGLSPILFYSTLTLIWLTLTTLPRIELKGLGALDRNQKNSKGLPTSWLPV